MTLAEFSVLFSAAVFAFILGGVVRGIFFQQEAIDHGCAHYAAQTAEFTWGPGVEGIQCQAK